MDNNVHNFQLTEDDYDFFSSVRLSIIRALVAEVIPSLRAIFF